MVSMRLTRRGSWWYRRTLVPCYTSAKSQPSLLPMIGEKIRELTWVKVWAYLAIIAVTVQPGAKSELSLHYLKPTP